MAFDQLRYTAFCACLFYLGGLLPCRAAAQGSPADAPEPRAEVRQRSIEDLNVKGAAASYPPFTDSVLGADTEFRRDLLDYGLVIRLVVDGAYIQNTLAAPVSAVAQTYIGQRPYREYDINPALTWDLRQFGLRRAQFVLWSGFEKASWNPAAPAALGVGELHLYKEFGEDRVEMKIGYIENDAQFMGLQIGGKVASGAQGVYAVLPYEVGLSYGPVEAPAIDLKYRFDSGLYLKGSAQRATEPGSEEAALKRDAVALRFLPHGDKLVLVGETGFNRPSADGRMSEWVRAGYIANNTPYTSLRTGLQRSGNYCAYLLADRQLWQPEKSNASRGIYAGVTAMAVPGVLDVYRSYYEARIYYEAPFRKRPDDFASVVSSYSDFSRDYLHSLAVAGKSYSRATDSVTGSYTVHVARGTYMGIGLSYVNGPSVTPKTPSALTFTAQTSIFF